MLEPKLVADCVAAMKAAVKIPVTVKCRIGVDEQDPDQALFAFAEAVKAAGTDALIVHARKAWLKGLSPRENREVPPLDYACVHRLKRAHPDLGQAGAVLHLVRQFCQAFVGSGRRRHRDFQSVANVTSESCQTTCTCLSEQWQTCP